MAINAADGHAFEPKLARLREQRQGRTHRMWFGRRGKDAAKPDMVGNADHRLRPPEIVVARHAEPFVRPDAVSGLGRVAVVAADVHALRIDCTGQGHIVIDDERDACCVGQPLHGVRLGEPCGCRAALDTKLQGIDTARKGLGNQCTQPLIVGVVGCNGVQAAQGGSHVSWV